MPVRLIQQFRLLGNHPPHPTPVRLRLSGERFCPFVFRGCLWASQVWPHPVGFLSVFDPGAQGVPGKYLSSGFFRNLKYGVTRLMQGRPLNGGLNLTRPSTRWDDREAAAGGVEVSEGRRLGHPRLLLRHHPY